MKNNKEQSNCSINKEDNLNESENIIENYQNGSYYKGQKKNNMRDGYGKFYYSDGGNDCK